MCLLRISLIVVALVVAPAALAANLEERRALFEMELEELLALEVSVASRTSNSRWLTPAAVTVITQDDISRSGLRTLPEILRLVPGMHVGRIDGNKWAIASRRAPSRYAADMLILMDGRTLYNPMFGGTYWDIQDTIIEDIDRIEVIRGPGGSSWGANAVTGIVNIVSRPARLTPGGMLAAGGGAGEIRSETAARWSGKVADNTWLRVYGKSRELAEGEWLPAGKDRTLNKEVFPVAGVLPAGDGAGDGQKAMRGGFRLEHQAASGLQLMASGEAYDAESSDMRLNTTATRVTANDTRDHGHHVLFEAVRPADPSAGGFPEWRARLFHANQFRNAGIFLEDRDVTDAEAMLTWAGESHRTSAGLGFRRSSDRTAADNGGRFKLDPAARSDDLYSVFMQDEWTLRPGWTLTAGSKFEHNDYTGNETSPSLRLMMAPHEHRALWVAATRTSRTPSRGDHDAYLDFNDVPGCPPPFTNVPGLGCIQDTSSGSIGSYAVRAVEAGWREQWGGSLLTELSLYRDDEMDRVDYSSGQKASPSYSGVEVELQWQAAPPWRLTLAAGYHDAEGGGFFPSEELIGNRWFKARSLYQLSDSLSWNVFVYHDQEELLRDPFTRLDMTWIWHAHRALECQFILNNLLEGAHGEASESTRVDSGVRRGGELLLRYRF